MQLKLCDTCAHFRLHYVLRHGLYWPTEGGHCVYPRHKLRARSTPACERWQQKVKEPCRRFRRSPAARRPVRRFR